MLRSIKHHFADFINLHHRFVDRISFIETLMNGFRFDETLFKFITGTQTKANYEQEKQFMILEIHFESENKTTKKTKLN